MRVVLEKRMTGDVLPALRTGMSNHFAEALDFQIEPSFFEAVAEAGERSQVLVKFSDSVEYYYTLFFQYY